VRLLAELDDNNARITSACAHLTSQIERLREYRQALITAAVTGQLDLDATSADDTSVPLAADLPPTHGSAP
jgi:hypothetical protein